MTFHIISTLSKTTRQTGDGYKRHRQCTSVINYKLHNQ